jgi:hypothetical protein
MVGTQRQAQRSRVFVTGGRAPLFRVLLGIAEGASRETSGPETRRLREAELLTSGVVAQRLGSILNPLRLLEGTLFEPVPQRGKRGLRIFTPEQVEEIREPLRKATRMGPEPGLLSLEEVARRAGVRASTLRRHQSACAR